MTLDQRIASVAPMMAAEALALGFTPADDLWPELLAAARLQLVRADASFDPRRAKWSTFAKVVIKRAMVDEIRKGLRKRPDLLGEADVGVPAAEADELTGVDVAALLADPTIPRLYRRALKAGSATGVYRTGLSKPEARKVFQWATYTLRRKLGDR